MKRKNGFTLIELLAVIVILAVIALIATPLIMNTINDAKDSAMQRSVGNIQHAAENHLMSKKVLDTNYTFTMSDFDYKGEKYDKMNIAFNDKDEAGVSVYKDNKCFYVLPGSSNVVIDKELDEAGCLAKAGTVLAPGMNEYGFYFNKEYSGMVDFAGEQMLVSFTFYENNNFRYRVVNYGEFTSIPNSLIYEYGKAYMKEIWTVTNNGTQIIYHSLEGDDYTYTIESTEGLTLNEYGFYFDAVYRNDGDLTVQFSADGSSSITNANCTYELNKITQISKDAMTFSANGKQLTVEGMTLTLEE